MFEKIFPTKANNISHPINSTASAPWCDTVDSYSSQNRQRKLPLQEEEVIYESSREKILWPNAVRSRNTWLWSCRPTHNQHPKASKLYKSHVRSHFGIRPSAFRINVKPMSTLSFYGYQVLETIFFFPNTKVHGKRKRDWVLVNNKRMTTWLSIHFPKT